MNIAFQLFQLQNIDSEIDKIKDRLKEIDELIRTNQDISRAEKNFEKQKHELAEKTNSFNEINYQIEKKKIKKSQSQSSLYSGKVQNPKELEDLQNEIESLDKVINSLDHSLLQELVALDDAEKALEKARENLRTAKSKVATELSMFNAESDKLLQQMEGLENKREPIYSNIDESSKKKYELLRKKKMGIAVTTLSEKSCNACGNNLTASEQQLARSPSQVFVCPNCGRIIYGSS